MSNVPKFDSRDAKQLLQEVKQLAKQYTPEWNFSENSDDFGVVFAKVFCQMMESTLSRYNKMSYNYYLTFLNMLGTQLRPSAPAKGFVTVKSSEDNPGTYVEPGTAVFAEADTEDGTVMYETVDALTVVDAKISKIFFTEPDSDFIGCAFEAQNSEEEEQKVGRFRIFDNVFCENLQCHEVYVADEDMFNMAKSNIDINFFNSMSAKGQQALPEIFADRANAHWEYFNGENWVSVDSVNKTKNGVNIEFDGKCQITEIMGTTSRFIRCRFDKIPTGGITLTDIKYKAAADNVLPDGLFANDTDLSNKNFFPFEEEYTIYNTFSIACDEAFVKKGATVELDAEIQFVKIQLDSQVPGKKYKMVMSEYDFADMQPNTIEIEKVVWEYWNGLGWSLLKTDDDDNNQFFRVDSNNNNTHRKLKFVCPNDLEIITIGSHEGRFIRARIARVKNSMEYYAGYLSPYIQDVKISYHYDKDDNYANRIFVKSDLHDYTVDLSDDSIKNVMLPQICEYPAMYICLDKPLLQGMVRMFVDIQDGVHRFNPTLKWEYLADDHKGGAVWKHIDTIDSTESFSHSEMITLIGKNDFKQDEIFGTEGYFLRVVNPDKKYSSKENISGRPVINNITFNAVRIVQKDTQDADYFSIEQDEESKLCKLSHENATDVSVWVDEIGTLSSDEQEKLMKKPPSEVEAEYNELGQVERLWIKWAPVDNLVNCGMKDRAYQVDYSRGEILFGNGVNGKIPPEQYNESIKVYYSVCHGSKGNVPEHSIQGFTGLVGNVEKVDNPEPILGGVDMETIDEAACRMFGEIAGGNRIVSLDDFERAICSNDRNIYKVKCLAHVNEDSQKEIGMTSVAVLPYKFMQGPDKFRSIKDKIWAFVDEKAPATLSQAGKLRIFEVGYVETNVDLDVVIDDFNHYQSVFSGIEVKLKQFLNPVSGNFSGKGWGIGQFPRKELIYNYIKTVPNIKWIKSINIFTYLITQEGKKEVDYEQVIKNKFVVPVYGEPNINISIN